jgi:hypothetical protein
VPEVLEYSKPDSRAGWNVVLGHCNAWFIVLGLWIAWFLSPIAELIVGLLIALVVRRLFRKFRSTVALVAVALVISPFTGLVACGTADYFRGTASLEGHGLMHGTSRVDPATRLQFTSRGCVSFGDEWLTLSPYNATVRFWTRARGPMAGTYSGPYPDEATARAAVAAAKPFDLKQLPTDTLLIDGKVIHLRTGLGTEIQKAFREGPAADPADPLGLKIYGEAHATVYKTQCVILAIPCAPKAAGAINDVIMLLDASTGRVFATYRAPSVGSFAFFKTWR